MVMHVDDCFWRLLQRKERTSLARSLTTEEAVLSAGWVKWGLPLPEPHCKDDSVYQNHHTRKLTWYENRLNDTMVFQILRITNMAHGK